MTTRFTTAFLSLAALVLGTPLVFAQTRPNGDPVEQRYIDPERGLSLDDAVTQAIAREPTYRAAQADIEAALAMRQQAALRPNPSTSVERREEPGGTDNQTAVQIQWPLDLFRRGTRMAVADGQIEAIEQAVADRRRRLVADVRTQYGRTAAAIREYGVVARVAASLGQTLELLRARVTEGAIPPLERDQWDVEWRRAEADRLVAQGGAEAALVELGRMIGMDDRTLLRLRNPLDTIAPAPLENAAAAFDPTAPPDVHPAR